LSEKKLNPEDLESLKRSGRITATILTKAKSLLRPGISKLQICEKIENSIKKMGAIPAFPVNISISEQAAHYTSPPLDESILPSAGVAKLDIGVAINGWIADSAISVALSKKYETQVQICQKALDKAITLVKDGVRVGTLSSAIQEEIESAGFVPVKNLTGHQINQYNLHAGMTIPNVKSFGRRPKLKAGMIIAIEPFATTGRSGWVTAGPNAYIFSLKAAGKNNLTQNIWNQRKRLPFCMRWLNEISTQKVHKNSERTLEEDRNIVSYPVLIDQEQGIISHFEHTVIVGKNGYTVLTHRN